MRKEKSFAAVPAVMRGNDPEDYGIGPSVRTNMGNIGRLHVEIFKKPMPSANFPPNEKGGPKAAPP